uniref:Uncharacterized protein n=1 Tax=Daphnia magna TaxID=35525 RepID=A0A0P6CDW6_9CRUS
MQSTTRKCVLALLSTRFLHFYSFERIKRIHSMIVLNKKHGRRAPVNGKEGACQRVSLSLIMVLFTAMVWRCV